jgi:hypothetical protein
LCLITKHHFTTGNANCSSTATSFFAITSVLHSSIFSDGGTVLEAPKKDPAKEGDKMH